MDIDSGNVYSWRMKRTLPLLIFAGLLSACAPVAVNVNAPGLTSAQQAAVKAVQTETVVYNGLKTLHDGAATAEQAGLVSAAQQAQVNAWISAVAKDNDAAAAATVAFNTGAGSAGSLAGALTILSQAIAATPSIVGIKDANTAAEVTAWISALTSAGAQLLPIVAQIGAGL
jgi:hypothetical protein